jgi:PIN domain nuclease of toxin-antitoxin system
MHSEREVSRLPTLDPFDRMIMAQAELENLPVITYISEFRLCLSRDLILCEFDRCWNICS